MHRSPAPTAPGQLTPLYPDLTDDHQPGPFVSLNSTVNNVQHVAAAGISPMLLPQPTPPSGGHTKEFPIVHKTSTPPLQSALHYPAVMPGPTAHHYTQVPPPPFPAAQKTPANPPPVVYLQEAPQTRAPSFPAVQIAPAQHFTASTSASSNVLFEAPKHRY